MRHVNALRMKLACQALREAAQREFAHGEWCRLDVALDAGGCAREQDRTLAAWQHAPCGLLRHLESPIDRDRNGFCHLHGVQVDERSAGAITRTVYRDVGC